MFAPHISFAERCRSGQATPAEIDDYIGAWHANGDVSIKLHEYLGLTWDEYAAFLRKPSALDDLLKPTKEPRA